MIGGGGGRDIQNALGAGQKRGRRDRAQRRDPRRRRRRPRGAGRARPTRCPACRRRSATAARTLAARDTKYDAIHIGFTDTLSANSAPGLRAHREQPLHASRPSTSTSTTSTPRRAERLPAPAAGRRRGAARDRARARPRSSARASSGRSATSSCCSATTSSTSGSAPSSPARSRGRAAELARIRQLAGERGDGVAYAPGGPYRYEWAGLAQAAGWESFCHGYRLDVCPPTDDRPFFFNMTRLGDLASAPPAGYFYAHRPDPRAGRSRWCILLVLCAVAFGLPLALVPRGAPPAGARAGVLRGDRARLPAARDRADPALRAVPRLPDLRALGRAVLAAAVHRPRRRWPDAAAATGAARSPSPSAPRACCS